MRFHGSGRQQARAEMWALRFTLFQQKLAN
jgi:hypothetical protein